MKNGVIEVFPDFKVCRSKDLMVRGRSFYAVWDDETKLWSTDEYDVQRLVDNELYEYRDKIKDKRDANISVKSMSDFSTGSWTQFQAYVKNLSDNARDLDTSLTFLSDDTTKKDYASMRLPYDMAPGSIESYDTLMNILYEPSERMKFEWCIGAIITGDSQKIQKFLVFFGESGTGKSTVLEILQQIVEGYYTTFEAAAITSRNNAFSTEAFKSNPLVAIQHDGDLSRIEDNSKLNSIVSHEMMTINEKYKAQYSSRLRTFLIMGTNKAVKITDAKSGIVRRLIDVSPTGKLVSAKKYHELFHQIQFEIGAIAQHCKDTYLSMGKNYYNDYVPTTMIHQTDVFFNFVESYFLDFKKADGVRLQDAYSIYKTYCEDALIEYKLPRHKFKEELKSYFETFEEVTRVDGVQVRSYYSGFKASKFDAFKEPIVEEHQPSLTIEDTESIFDELAADYTAQYASSAGTPKRAWSDVKTTLKSIDTSKEHYVKVPLNHIVIDFDITDENGNKDMGKNLEAASKWPTTYSEFSKSGGGIHLHYIYTGPDPEMLSRVYSPGIEVKVYVGDSALRRRLSFCNNVPVQEINSGLPLKEAKVYNQQVAKGEAHIRDMIIRNMQKEFHPGTKSSIDFIHHILEEQYALGVAYDVSDMKQSVFNFAAGSTNQRQAAIRQVMDMKFSSEKSNEELLEEGSGVPFSAMSEDPDLYVFDVEVYKNLFIIVYKNHRTKAKTELINPTATCVAELLQKKLVAFNNRRYDNHILYAASLGYTNMELYNLSQRLIDNDLKNQGFREAYNLSYADLFELASTKQSLKKWQIEMGVTHMEMELPWDEPVDEKDIPRVVLYCGNDVDSTDDLLTYIKPDWDAREILVELSGLTMNHTTQQHAARIIFGTDKNFKDEFEYTMLSDLFPGYKYEFGVSKYRDVVTGEGGYVYAKPGVHRNVFLFDIESQHPTSAILMRIFGKYTQNYSDLKEGRVAIKHKNLDELKTLLGGKLWKFVDGKSDADLDKLSYAMKIVINIVYGMTSAKFDNPFRDARNEDNIVAKRGALFMVELQYELDKRGVDLVHIKTDSIKIANPTQSDVDFVMDFGQKYGYKFVHEATYSVMALVNDAVYIAKVGWAEKEYKIGTWEAVGARFKHPIVYKTLFSKEPITFEDYFETKSVKTAIYLDYNHGLPEENKIMRKEYNKLIKDAKADQQHIKELAEALSKCHNYTHVGKIGQFVPTTNDQINGKLVRKNRDNLTYSNVTGTSDWRWTPVEYAREFLTEKDIDQSYYKYLIDDAVTKIQEVGDYNLLFN